MYRCADEPALIDRFNRLPFKRANCFKRQILIQRPSFSGPFGPSEAAAFVDRLIDIQRLKSVCRSDRAIGTSSQPHTCLSLVLYSARVLRLFRSHKRHDRIPVVPIFICRLQNNSTSAFRSEILSSESAVPHEISDVPHCGCSEV